MKTNYIYKPEMKVKENHLVKQLFYNDLFNALAETETNEQFKTGLDYINYLASVNNNSLESICFDNKGNNKTSKVYEEITKPVKAYIFKFSHKFKTVESYYIYSVSKNGLFMPTQYYNDFVNEVFTNVLELSINNPMEEFTTILFEATKKGLTDCFKSISNLKRVTDKKESKSKGKQVQKYINPCVSYEDMKESILLDEEETNRNDIASVSTLESDIIKAETEEENKQLLNEIMTRLDGKTSLIFKAIANGIKYKAIAKYLGVTENNIKQAVKYHRQQLKKVYNR